MKKINLFFFVFFVLVILEISFVTSAHFIIGRVNDALDGVSANDKFVFLWNPINGINDNLTDIVGINGNSGQNNLYMIDCELLDIPCEIGDIMSIKIFDDGEDEYFTPREVNVTVTGAGFDLASNLTLNSPPNITSIFVDDDTLSPLDEIDLVAASTRKVYCVANVTELDGDSIQNINSSFFGSGYSFETLDDNNYHYINSSCYINNDFGGENDSQINCSFSVYYYANPSVWTCQIKLEDEHFASRNNSDNTQVNELLSIGLVNSVDFGVVDSFNVSDEIILNVTNYGNIKVNLSLSGYGGSEEDNYSMVCSGGEIPIGFTKYNLTSSIEGELSYQMFDGNYTNLTSIPIVREFNLDYRIDDLQNDRINETYWRIYVPGNVGGNCNGAIVLGAVRGVGE